MLIKIHSFDIFRLAIVFYGKLMTMAKAVGEVSERRGLTDAELVWGGENDENFHKFSLNYFS